jgi:GNAT superfamily N-acetyltransferase
VVRDARAEDVPALAPLVDQLGYPAPEALLRERLAALAARGDRVLVAELDGRVVGFLTTHTTPVLHRAAEVGRISAMAVDERVRGTGVGRALVAAAEAILRSAGCERMEVTSATRRRDAHAFYEALGYEGTGVRFSRTLAE